jgi:hypothetical protein
VVNPAALVLVCVAVVGAAVAAEAELRVVAPELAVGQVGAVRVVVRGQRPTAPPRLRVSPDSGLDIAYEQQANQVTIVQGRVHESTEFVYRVLAIEPGRYVIGPARVEIGAREIATGTAEIVVTEGAKAAVDGVTAYAGFTVERAYVGQVVVFRRGVRSSLPIDRDAWTAAPLEGLLPPRDGAPAYSEYVLRGDQGQTFVKEEYHPRMVTAAGDRQVPASAARVAVRVPSAGRGPFAIGRSRTEVAAAPASALRVEPLPPSPQGFSGLVGRFTFELDVDRTEAVVGDSINLVLRAQGDGALDGLALPRPPAELPVRVYDGSPATTARVDGSGYRSEGSFSRVIVPTRPGVVAVGPLSLVTFDPVEGRYVTHRLEVPPIRVSAGKSAGSTAAESFLDVDTDPELPVAPAFEGVRDIRVAGRAHTPWLGPFLPFLLVASALPLALLGALASARGALAAAQRLRRPRRAVALTPQQRLARLPSEPAARLAALDGALRSAVAAAAGVSVGALDRDLTLGHLGAAAEPARAAFRRFDRARFGDGHGADGAERAVREAIDALRGRR